MVWVWLSCWGSRARKRAHCVDDSLTRFEMSLKLGWVSNFKATASHSQGSGKLREDIKMNTFCICYEQNRNALWTKFEYALPSLIPSIFLWWVVLKKHHDCWCPPWCMENHHQKNGMLNAKNHWTKLAMAPANSSILPRFPAPIFAEVMKCALWPPQHPRPSTSRCLDETSWVPRFLDFEWFFRYKIMEAMLQ